MKFNFSSKIIIMCTCLFLTTSLLFIGARLILPPALIVSNFGGGRLGDQMMCYCKAKYLSHKYNIPLVVFPFKNSDQLALTSECTGKTWSYRLMGILYKLFGQTMWVHTENDLSTVLKTAHKPTRFIVHLSTRLAEHVKLKAGLTCDSAWISSLLYELMLQHPDFGIVLKKMLQPTYQLTNTQLPKNQTTVAVHIRTGEGFDGPLGAQQYYDTTAYRSTYETFYVDDQKSASLSYSSRHIPQYVCHSSMSTNPTDKHWGDKFPPEQYYVDQIKKLSNMLDNAPLYVHIFTDAANAHALTERIKNTVHKPNIAFACNATTQPPLNDCFAMAQYNCLIRAGSGFAYLAQIIGAHKIIMFPLHLTWHDPDMLIVDKVGIIFRNHSTQGNAHEAPE